MKTIYQCEACGKTFDKWNDCWDHEQTHIEPSSLSVKAVRYLTEDCDCLCDSNDPHPYPLDIHVPMDDGSIIQYTFDRIIAPAPAAAPIEEETAYNCDPIDNAANHLEAANE